MKKIIELLYRFYDKQIDTDFIYEFIDIVTEYKDLEPYINNVDFSKTSNDDGYVASYCTNTGVITIYFDEVMKIINDGNNYQSFLSLKEKSLDGVLSVVQVILHEIEHARQKKLRGTDSSLEAQILRLSSIEISFDDVFDLIRSGYDDDILMKEIIEKKELYKKFYKYCPSERLAQINSYEEIISYLDMMPFDTSKLTMINDFLKTHSLLSGYDKKCPTFYFIKQFGKDTEYKLLDIENSDISSYEKMKLGLYVPKDEINKHIKKLTLFD